MFQQKQYASLILGKEPLNNKKKIHCKQLQFFQTDNTLLCSGCLFFPLLTLKSWIVDDKQEIKLQWPLVSLILWPVLHTVFTWILLEMSPGG